MKEHFSEAPEKQGEEIRAALEQSNASVAFKKGNLYRGWSLNGIEFAPVDPKELPEWRSMPDAMFEDEPEFVLGPKEKSLRTAAGIIAIEEEKDGTWRVWIYEPANHFGGYEHTFPKGRPEPRLTLQQTAKKEMLEETGLLAEITGYLGDYSRTTTKTRYYLGKRIGGDPSMADGYRKEGEIEEVWAVKLIPLEKMEDYLNTDFDRKILKDLVQRYKKELEKRQQK